MKKTSKLLLGLIIIVVGSAPIALFLPLIKLGKVEWYLMIRKFPDGTLYFIAVSVFVCCLYMIFCGIRFWYKTLTKDNRDFTLNTLRSCHKKHMDTKKKCTTCKFNDGTDCVVGSHYAAKSTSAVCYEGELWEKFEGELWEKK